MTVGRPFFCLAYRSTAAMAAGGFAAERIAAGYIGRYLWARCGRHAAGTRRA